MFTYTLIRKKLWEVRSEDRKVLGRIRHVLKPDKEEVGWQSSDGHFYEKAAHAATALLEEAG